MEEAREKVRQTVTAFNLLSDFVAGVEAGR